MHGVSSNFQLVQHIILEFATISPFEVKCSVHIKCVVIMIGKHIISTYQHIISTVKAPNIIKKALIMRDRLTLAADQILVHAAQNAVKKCF